MDNAVRSYSDFELLKRCSELPNFKKIPDEYWLLFVRSNEDTPDVFDDKVYLFKGTQFIKVTSCTTNPGLKGLKNYQAYNPKGTFVAKSDFWNYDVWTNGLHRGKMPALVQRLKIFGYRDNNRNNKSEEIGEVVSGFFGINFHCIDYNLRPGFFRRLIGGWSVGCFVLNYVDDYLFFLGKLKGQEKITMCLINEF